MPATFDPDDYELRWPPQLFVDEAKRLQDRKSSLHGGIFSGADWGPDVEWLLTEAFVSTAPADLFKRVQSYEGSGGRDPRPEQWLSADPRGGHLARARHLETVLVGPHHWPHQLRSDGVPRR